MMRYERPSLTGESTRDSLESSEIGSDAFTHNLRFQQHNNNNHYNRVSQHIYNNNNKITIIIKHNEGTSASQNLHPQVIYIQPAAASQPNLNSHHQLIGHQQSIRDLTIVPEMYNSLDDLDVDEHYQFYNESAVDVPDDFKRNSYLVLNLNDAANKRMKRRICTPTRNLRPIDNPNYPEIESRTFTESEKLVSP